MFNIINVVGGTYVARMFLRPLPISNFVTLFRILSWLFDTSGDRERIKAGRLTGNGFIVDGIPNGRVRVTTKPRFRA